MAFDLLDRPALYIPVKWPGLAIGAEGEAVETEHEIDVQVQILDNSAIEQWRLEAAPKDGETWDKDETDRRAVSTFRGVATGWRKVVARGQPLPFTDENIQSMVKVPGFAMAFITAYLEAWRGKVATRTGNSEGSPANGRTDGPTAATPAEKTSTS